MNYELKRDRTNGKTEAAIDPKHVLIATIEDKAVRAIAIALAWRRTTIVPALSGAAERRPETVARSRKEDSYPLSRQRGAQLRRICSSASRGYIYPPSLSYSFQEKVLPMPEASARFP